MDPSVGSGSRVKAIISGGTTADQQRLREALERIYNPATTRGQVELLVTSRPDGSWIIEMAHMYGGGTLHSPDMPRGIPTDVRRQVVEDLRGAGIPIKG